MGEEAAAYALAGTIVGFSLGLLRDLVTARRLRQAQWRALRAEFEACSQMAANYLNPENKAHAPSYRWPVLAFQTHWPQLMADPDLSQIQIYDVNHFFEQVASMNRGLDMAQAANHAGQLSAAGEQTTVNIFKATNMR